ncbi:MAG: ApeA N-terminal domain 1-containing protein [bacterium]
MYKEFKIDGKWWLPDNEGEKIQGTLYFKPGKPIILELNGLFNRDKKTF